MITVRLGGLYLTRNAREVGIVQDRGEGQRWRWLTSRGYYVTCDGRASIAGGETSQDLVRDISMPAEHVTAADSMFGVV